MFVRWLNTARFAIRHATFTSLRLNQPSFRHANLFLVLKNIVKSRVILHVVKVRYTLICHRILAAAAVGRRCRRSRYAASCFALSRPERHGRYTEVRFSFHKQVVLFVLLSSFSIDEHSEYTKPPPHTCPFLFQLLPAMPYAGIYSCRRKKMFCSVL